MASLKFRHYATESALIGSNTLQVALNAMDVGDIVFIDDTQKQYIITSKNNNVVKYSTYYGKAAITGVTGTGATRTLTFSDGSEITITIDNVKHAITSESCSGNANSATTLQNTRKINGTNFNGSADITTNNWGTSRNIGIVNSDGSGTAIPVSINGSNNINLKLPSTIKANLEGNISGSSTSCSGNSATATNADTLDGYHVSSLVKFYLSPMASGAPADSAKSWFTDTMPSGSGAIVYNVLGSEKTIIAGKSTGASGHMLQLNYVDNYLRILRYYGGKWKTSDWEKVSAGHADTATVATTATTAINDGNGNVIASTYLPLSGGTITGDLNFSAGLSIKSANNTVLEMYSGVDTYLHGSSHIYLSTPSLYYIDASSIVRTVLHSGNYNSYSPTLTGVGATGTWGINISGNANTATTAVSAGSANTATNATNADLLDGQDLITQVSDWDTDSLSIFKSSENSISNAPTSDFIYGVTLRFHRSISVYHTDLVTSLYHDRLFFRRKTEEGYHTWRELIHDGNISSQSVNYATTSGACTGNAATATKLQTARKIWGQNFDGTGNISGSLEIFSTGGNWSEGIRIHPSSNGWSSIVLCESTNSGSLGTSTDTWSMHNYEGTFGIYKNGSTTSASCCISNINSNWIVKGGNVGIGTTSPTSKLHVAGTGYFTSDVSSASNIIAGGYIKGETVKISSGCTLQYDSAQKCVKFVF